MICSFVTSYYPLLFSIGFSLQKNEPIDIYLPKSLEFSKFLKNKKRLNYKIINFKLVNLLEDKNYRFKIGNIITIFNLINPFILDKSPQNFYDIILIGNDCSYKTKIFLKKLIKQKQDNQKIILLPDGFGFYLLFQNNSFENIQNKKYKLLDKFFFKSFINPKPCKIGESDWIDQILIQKNFFDFLYKEYKINNKKIIPIDQNIIPKATEFLQIIFEKELNNIKNKLKKNKNNILILGQPLKQPKYLQILEKIIFEVSKKEFKVFYKPHQFEPKKFINYLRRNNVEILSSSFPVEILAFLPFKMIFTSYSTASLVFLEKGIPTIFGYKLFEQSIPTIIEEIIKKLNGIILEPSRSDLNELFSIHS